jgi:hypothetical protein
MRLTPSDGNGAGCTVGGTVLRLHDTGILNRHRSLTEDTSIDGRSG